MNECVPGTWRDSGLPHMCSFGAEAEGNPWTWPWGWTSEGRAMVILFTFVQNQTKPHYIREVYLGGKRMQETNVIPRKLRRGRKGVGMGTAGRCIVIIPEDEK